MQLYDFEPARTFARSGSWMTIPDRDTALFYVDGTPDSPAGPEVVLFLHGIPTWSYLWRNVMTETSLGYRSVAVDLPGFGLSDKSPRHSFRVPELAKTIEAFIDELLGRDARVVLVAHDFGALVAAELLARSPARIHGLVQFNTSLNSENWSGRGPLRILGVPWLGDLSMMLARPWMLHLAMLPFVSDPAARKAKRIAGYWYPFECGFGKSLARLFREGAVSPADFDRWREAIANCSGRALLLWGKRDPAFGSNQFHDVVTLLSPVETVEFENANHFLPEERPRAAGRKIRAFLNRLQSTEQ